MMSYAAVIMATALGVLIGQYLGARSKAVRMAEHARLESIQKSLKTLQDSMDLSDSFASSTHRALLARLKDIREDVAFAQEGITRILEIDIEMDDDEPEPSLAVLDKGKHCATCECDRETIPVAAAKPPKLLKAV